MRPCHPTGLDLAAFSVCLLACLLASDSAHAQARHRFRARFEPTTLQLETPGRFEVDAQFGAIYGDGQDGSRLVAPDFELDLGILRWLELDLDGGFTVTHVNADAPVRRSYGEPMWTSAKVALFGHRDARTGRNVGVGLQFGPRFPSVRTAPGVGFAALALAGAGTRRVNVVASVGTVLDRGQSPGLVYGVDLSIVVDDRGAWVVLAELGGGHYFGSSVPDSLSSTLGFAYQASPSVGLSWLVLGGLLPGNDRLGALAGLSVAFGRSNLPAPSTPATNPSLR